MSARSVRRVSVALAIGAVVAAGGLLMSPPSGWADAPSAYGWWYEANAGLPVAPPAPPSVPADGMYVANDVSGPAAIAALSIPVPSGASMGPLVVHVAGTPLMSQPPVACPLRSAFKPAEAGAWSDRPTYDCAQAEKVGSVDSAKTTVTFDASPFLRDGAVGVVILAGGPTDQVAFKRPGPDTLPVSTAPGASPGGVAPGVSDTGNVAVPSVDTSQAPVQQGFDTTPFPASSVAPPAAVSPGGSAAAAAGIAPRALGTPPGAGSVGDGATKPSGWRTTTGGLLGVAAVLVALVAWTEGYGLLGGRVRSLASPLPRK